MCTPSTGTRATTPFFETATLEFEVPKSIPQEIVVISQPKKVNQNLGDKHTEIVFKCLCVYEFMFSLDTCKASYLSPGHPQTRKHINTLTHTYARRQLRLFKIIIHNGNFIIVSRIFCGKRICKIPGVTVCLSD